MVRPNNFRLITLGRLALVSPSGEDESVALRRRKLTLLAVLALSDRPYSRDALADMFWGEEDEERARHSLSDALSHFRRILGRNAIAHRRAEVMLSEEVRLGVDALEFAAACEARDTARAVELYAGPLLDGVRLDRSARFEEWMTRERDRYNRLFIRACEVECLALARARRWEECAALSRRWLAAAPLSADAALYLINAIKAPGSREAAVAALAEYQSMRALLEREYGTRPDQRITTLAAELSARVAEADGDPDSATRRAVAPPGLSAEPGAQTAAQRAVPAIQAAEDGTPARDATAQSPPASMPPSVAASSTPAFSSASVSAPPATPPVHSTPAAQAAARKRTLIAIAAAALSLALITGGTFLAGRRAATPVHAAVATHPVVAVTLIQNVRNDSSVAWLEEGLKQMIAADLSRSGAVEVVAPSRVRDVARRAQLARRGPLGNEDAIKLAKEVGATWAVSGGLTRGQGLYVLDVGLRDVATGDLVRLFTVTGSDILEVADQAASHILAAASAGGPGPRLADVETSNVGAYQHYVRAVQAHGEGRFAEELRELDAAIALDSGFVSAITARLRLAQEARDAPLVERLAAAFRAARGRATDWDWLYQGVYSALHNGEHARAVELGRQLVDRYPRDPRAYAMLADVYALYGRWKAADSVLRRALSLDSLATEAGHGPCAPCTAYGGLVRMRLAMGDLSGAEHAANRWVALQPDAPAPWSHLSEVLAYEGRYDSALTVANRASMLADDGATYAASVGRILLMARRFDDVDSVITVWLARDDDYRLEALDLRTMLLRERGQIRESNRVIERLVARYPAALSLELVRANGLARLGKWEEAVKVYEDHEHSTGRSEPPSPYRPLTGDDARAFAWEHALAADALAAGGDTIRLHALADSIESVGARSYYGRDWRLHHHVRALIAMRGGRLREAAEEFQKARWGVAGWTSTEARLARVYLALGEPRDAIAVLRDAYKSTPDAMGRYEPRSELDLLMAEAFRMTGMRDSSDTYAGYVRRAWAHADPEVKASLHELDES